jgi:hypothetical protein
VKDKPTTTVVVKNVSIGNQPTNARFFSRRPDVPAHFHTPLTDGSTQFFCGKCMFPVKLA